MSPPTEVPSDPPGEEAAPATPRSDSPADGPVVQRLTDQLAHARVERELARLDLEWEVERRQFLTVTSRTPAGEVPRHSTAVAFLVVGSVFALGMALVVLTSSAGLFLLLLLGPLVALTAFIVASGVEQYRRASRYHAALARYEGRRDRVRVTPPEAGTACEDRAPDAADPLARRLVDQVAEAHYQAELARLDRQWEIEQQKHYVTTRRGGRFLPDRQHALGSALGGLVFGVAMVLAGTPAFFPYFGVLFALLGVGGGIHLYSLARRYERALAAYRSRRQSLRSEQFRPARGHDEM